jgi:hypothetical protein
MNRKKIPYVARCAFCEQGLLRLLQCQNCQAVAAICDECELVWDDVAAVSADPQTRSAAAFPRCPACRTKDATWSRLNKTQIKRAGLNSYLAGESS